LRDLMMAILLASSTTLWAGTTGKIAGKVTDRKTREPILGVNVIIEGTARGAITDGDGFYQIINIPPGSYTLSARFIGYGTQRLTNVAVSVDRTTQQNITLEQQVIEGQEVTIQAERPAIEMDRTHTASVVSTETVEMMPVTTVDEVIQLQSGVVNEDGELHFRGGRSREVSYLIDGVPVTNAFDQSGGNNVVVENAMIQELEVISGTFNAEYGSAQSGIVNIITKGPAKRFSGSVQTYIGDWLSSHDELFLGIKNFNPVSEKDGQFSLSGPLSSKIGIFITGRHNSWESRDWYQRRFQSVDGWRIAAYRRWFQQHNLSESQTSIAIAIPDSLATGDYSEGPLTTGSSTSLSTKIGYYPSPKLNFTYQLFGSLQMSRGDDPDINTVPNSGSRRYAPDGGGTSEEWSHSHFFALHHFPASTFFYNLNLSYQYNIKDDYYRKDNKIARYPGDSGIQLLSADADGFSLGTTDGFYTGKSGKNYRTQTLVSGDFNWQIDKYNFLKAGFIAKWHTINTYSWGYKATDQWENLSWPNRDLIDGANYTYEEYWSLLTDYWKNWEEINLADRYVAYADSEYTLWRNYNIKPREAALYLQDKIELGEIIINAGLRFDLFDPNERYIINPRTEALNLGRSENMRAATIKYQASPRLGISFPISATGAFHAAYGHFFQMPSFEYMYNTPLYAMTRLQLEGKRLGNANLKAEKTVAYEIGLQQQLTSTIVADITAYYKDIRNLLGIEQITTLDAVSYTRFINRDYGYTKGISLGISKTSGDWFTGGINYTYAYANGSSSDPTALYLVQSATQIGGAAVQFVDRKILSLNWDQRHTLNMYLNFFQSGNWSVGLVGYLNSGMPYSPTFVEKYDINEREYRNGEMKPSRWSLDLKAKKFFRIAGLRSSLFLKVDNLFDHLNQNSVHSSTGRADQVARLPENQQLLLDTLEQEGLFTIEEYDLYPSYFSDPRRVQVGLEINF
jgi:outer membrane receptor protein involved in Fe transport